MALTINTNLAAINAVGNLDRTTRSLNSTFARISSGSRISKAGDDAAGLGVAEKLDALNRGLRQALRNANDGVSVVEVAEGATAEVTNIIKRLRELAVQSASETLADTERTYIQTEVDELEAEISRIAASTNFNGVATSDGSTTQLNVQVGASNTTNDQIALSLGDLTTTALGLTGIDLSTAANASNAITDIDNALELVNSYRSVLGAGTNRLESAIRNLEVYTDSITGAESRIRDADFAYETAELSRFQILQQAGLAVLAQANQINSGALRLLG